jgi:uncharacterized protein (DUF885 family)
MPDLDAPGPDARSTPPSAFEITFAEFLDAYLEHHPTAATAIGDHRFDDRWPDVSDAGRGTRLDHIDGWASTFASMDRRDLSPDERIDRDLIVMQLAAERFDEVDLQDDRWDPMTWVYLLGDGLFNLISRDFAPLAERLVGVAGRLETMPRVIDGAREALVGADDGRPVGRFQTETAIDQLPGIGSLIDDALAQAAGAASTDPAVEALRPRLEAAASSARSALADLELHLRDVVLPRSEGDGRLGIDLFERKMRHTMRSEALTPERILAQADREYVVVRAEMVRLAREIWPTWRPGEPIPTDDNDVVRQVLDAIAADHPAADDLIAFCRAEHDRVEAFCRERDLIGLGEEPMEIRWTPEFLRATGGAMLISPGPLDRGLMTFFAITPMPEDWSAERRESYLREDNARMLRLLTIHEATPGHYLQGVYANRAPSLARTIFGSGLFAEGWAVYVTQVMMDVGYGADDPALLLTHWKFYLRSITNAILDARIHTAGMTLEEALALMVDGGFQEDAEARAKFDRARLSSTQLSTYFAGSMEMWDIELQARRRMALAEGVDPKTLVPPRELPGGFASTPGFRYRHHLEAVIGHGEPPTSLLRRILFEASGPAGPA